MSHRISSRRAFLGEAAAAGLVLAARPAFAQVGGAQITSRSFPPPGSRIIINESRMVFDEMVLQQGVEISFAPTITSLEITCRKLVLNGDCTLDLRRLAALPEKPPTPPLAVTTPLPTGVNGPNGTPGTPGLKGANGIALKFTIDALDAANGSLWIRTDGGPGGPGGDGGDGIPGGGLGEAVHHCKDGGTGGDGGPGGAGGDGGDTSAVSVTVGGVPVRPIADAPPALGSARPAEATGHGRIVIFGTPGSAGTGGTGGRGGHGGLGQVCPAEPVDGKPGHPGHNGPPGTNGNPGKVTL